MLLRSEQAIKIGVFDSGYGGLTILSSIRRVLPQYDYIYLGDNARAPYGTHSFDVIYRYTLQAVNYLLSQDCTLIILACNTASAKALRTIQQRDLPLINEKMGNNRSNECEIRKCENTKMGKCENAKMVNVLGVIRPTVEAVPSITKTGHVGILGTPATISSQSYVLELAKIAPSLMVTQQACPMWVPLIEAGEHNKPGADYFVEEYLNEILSQDPKIDTLVLGCTHYPLLNNKTTQWLNRWYMENDQIVNIISQGDLVANSLADYLARHPEYASQLSLNGTCRYLTTENADRFSQSASLFLAEKISAEHIILI